MEIWASRSLALADLVLLFLKLKRERFLLADDLFLHLLEGFPIALGRRLVRLVFQEQFALGDLGGVKRIQRGEFFFFGRR